MDPIEVALDVVEVVGATVVFWLLPPEDIMTYTAAPAATRINSARMAKSECVTALLQSSTFIEAWFWTSHLKAGHGSIPENKVCAYGHQVPAGIESDYGFEP